MRLHVGVHAAAFSIQFSRKPFESPDGPSARPSGAVPAVSAESNSAIDSPARLYEIVWEVVAASFEPPAQTASAGVDPAAAPIIIVESPAGPGGGAAVRRRHRDPEPALVDEHAAYEVNARCPPGPPEQHDLRLESRACDRGRRPAGARAEFERPPFREEVRSFAILDVRAVGELDVVGERARLPAPSREGLRRRPGVPPPVPPGPVLVVQLGGRPCA